jgi:hypothetical protein
MLTCEQVPKDRPASEDASLRKFSNNTVILNWTLAI